MLGRTTIFAIVLCWASMATGPFALAQGRRGMRAPRPAVPHSAPPAKAPKAAHDSIDEFARMSPEQREKTLAKLPPERAEKLRKQLDEYSKMTPQQQAAAREQLAAFRNLPPQRQEEMRKAFSNFSRQPVERQQVIREELDQLRGLPEADRQARLNSPEFQGLFTNNERKIIRDMSGLLP